MNQEVSAKKYNSISRLSLINLLQSQLGYSKHHAFIHTQRQTMNLNGQPELKVDYYQKVLLEDPLNTVKWAELVRTSVDSGDLALAQFASQSCKILSVSTCWIDLYRGYLHLKEGNFSDALSIFRELLSTSDNQDILTWSNRWAIDALLCIGETEEASNLLIKSYTFPLSADKEVLECKIADYLDSREVSSTIDLSGRFQVSLLAFYLPQFHPFPENDKWWGPGFSEWVNISDAECHFTGHYQPRRPGALGFYDLRNPLTQRQQAKLAKRYGISAFCYYLYWFSGKEIMEEPIKNMLADKTIDIDFCICWANETWSRRWDGSESDVLIEQKYTNDDATEFPKYLSQFLSDPRYFRVEGKPLILIYRPDQIPNIQEVLSTWRSVFEQLGIGQVHLTACLTFGYTHDRAVADGFDTANEFHPHNSIANELNKSSLQAKRFEGKIYDYREVVENSVKNLTIRALKTVHPCVMLGWDNTPRRGSKGNVFTNFDFHYYGAWILINRIKTELSSNTSKLLFINAWNEWCEGTYLEPDRVNQFRGLETTYQASKLDDYLPILLIALKLIAPYYENIRTFLLEKLSSTAVVYADHINSLLQTKEHLRENILAFHRDSTATYYYEKPNIIVCAEVATDSATSHSKCIGGWISGRDIKPPASSTIIIENASEYCFREVVLRIAVGDQRKDVEEYHKSLGKEFHWSSGWSIDLGMIDLLDNETIRAIIFNNDDWDESARINTNIVKAQESMLEAHSSFLLIDRVSEFYRFSDLWKTCAKISWKDSSPRLRASLLNSVSQAYIIYTEVSEAIL